MRIVVVEDETRTRQSMVKCIRKISEEYQVVAEAENGYEGIKAIRDLEPDVVITDIQMPKIDGMRMIEQVRELNLHPIFIILSGYAEFEYARRGLKLGVKDYLLKPITVAELKTTLEAVNTRSIQENGMAEKEYTACVKDMLETIQKEYGKQLSLDRFAGKYKMAPEYLSTLFAKETGQTYSNYIKEIRMEKAKQLLRESDLKIYEIACRVGVPDQKYFSKVFKEYTGISAKQYNAQNGENKSY